MSWPQVWYEWVMAVPLAIIVFISWCPLLWLFWWGGMKVWRKVARRFRANLEVWNSYNNKM